MRIPVPGDKSITQRGLILSALAGGESRLTGLLTGADPQATAAALRAMGAFIPPVSAWGQTIRVSGTGLRGLRAPREPLDLQNSGTGARLLLGVLAGQPLTVDLSGDASLRTRPMKRVTDPLSRMGASFRFLGKDGFLPLRVTGGELEPLEYRLPVASAQVKSALLLAGLVAGVPVKLWEPGRSRDHTENLLRGLGVSVISGAEGQGWTVSMPAPPEFLEPFHLEVPGDFSSAAFFLVLGLLASSKEPLVLEGVGLNPTRSGLLGVLQRMGARVEIQNLRGRDQGEPMGDLVVMGCELDGTRVEGPEIPGMIDEVPILAVAAARARGTTVITGARELRIKETDRIHALVQNLRVLGVRTEELDDGLVIQGTDSPLEGEVQSFGDHRIAMAFGVLGALPGNRIRVRGEESVGVSFPTFWNRLEELRNR